jgi:hypothetical protein
MFIYVFIHQLKSQLINKPEQRWEQTHTQKQRENKAICIIWTLKKFSKYDSASHYVTKIKSV